MDNKNYKNKNRELQPYHGFEDNIRDNSFDEHGNTLESNNQNSFHRSKALNLQNKTIQENSFEEKLGKVFILFICLFICSGFLLFAGLGYFFKDNFNKLFEPKQVTKQEPKQESKQETKQKTKEIFIQDLDRMNEDELIKVANEHYSGKTYIFDLRSPYHMPCNWKDIRKKFFEITFSRKYKKLLDILLTNFFENNILNLDDYVYEEAKKHINSDFSLIFIKHGIFLKKIQLAVENKDLNAVKQALESGESIDERCYDNSTPLYLAVKNNTYEIAEYLISKGALSGNKLDEYNNYGSILLFPIINKNYKMLELLVKNGILITEELKFFTNDRKILRFIISNGKSSISGNDEDNIKDKEWEEAYNCIMRDDLDGLIKLEKAGTDLSKMYYGGDPAICIAIEKDELLKNTNNYYSSFTKSGKYKIVEYLLKKYDCRKLVNQITGRNALHYAAMSSSARYLVLLLENGFDPNKLDNDNNSALNFACFSDCVRCVEFLKSKGAKTSINKMEQNCFFFVRKEYDENRQFYYLKADGVDINKKDIYGNTPLLNYLLKVHNKNTLINAFLLAGANIELDNKKKQTPLHIAILSNNYKSVSLLLNKRPKPNKQDIEGNTPLHYVAKYASNKRMVGIISYFKQSFDFTIRNNEGKTALYYAVANNKHEMAKFLVENGAKVDEQILKLNIDNKMAKILEKK